MSGHYLTVLNVLMMVVAAGVLGFAMVSLYRRAPKHHKRNRLHKHIVVSVIAVASISLALVFIEKFKRFCELLLQTIQISEAYENYGFVYCFTNSIIDTGISEPDDYSEKSVKKIVNKLDDSSKNQSKSKK